MIKHALITYAAVILALGILIALPDSVTSVAHSVPVAADSRAADCAAALTNALPELRETYSDICNNGYAIEGVAGRSYDADMCAESIMAELDSLQESTSAHIAGTPWQTIVSDCAALGNDAAYVKYVGPELPECVWEDGSDSELPCMWDGATRGNGIGATYIVTSVA